MYPHFLEPDSSGLHPTQFGMPWLPAPTDKPVSLRALYNRTVWQISVTSALKNVQACRLLERRRRKVVRTAIVHILLVNVAGVYECPPGACLLRREPCPHSCLQCCTVGLYTAVVTRLRRCGHAAGFIVSDLPGIISAPGEKRPGSVLPYNSAIWSISVNPDCVTVQVKALITSRRRVRRVHDIDISLDVR